MYNVLKSSWLKTNISKTSCRSSDADGYFEAYGDHQKVIVSNIVYIEIK